MQIQDCSHFDQVRAQNRKTIRNLMRNLPQIGKTELARMSGLSFPTISAVLNELINSQEVLILPEATSHGGRPGAEYSLNPLFRVAVCAYMEDYILHTRIYDVFGRCQKEILLPFPEEINPDEVHAIFTVILQEYPSISVISLGVPGVVLGGTIKYLPCYPNLDGFNLKEYLEEKMSIPVFIENDVNVFVSAERNQWPDLVHIFLSNNCPGSGILINGKLIRGADGSAGELEYMYIGDSEKGKTFGEVLNYIGKNYSGEAKIKEYISCLSHTISGVISMINPSDIALSGFGFCSEDLLLLSATMEKVLPRKRVPNFHIVSDVVELYHTGLLEISMDYLKSI